MKNVSPVLISRSAACLSRSFSSPAGFQIEANRLFMSKGLYGLAMIGTEERGFAGAVDDDVVDTDMFVDSVRMLMCIDNNVDGVSQCESECGC